MSTRTKDPHARCRAHSEVERERFRATIADRDARIAALENANRALREEVRASTLEGHALFAALRLTRERAQRRRP